MPSSLSMVCVYSGCHNYSNSMSFFYVNKSCKIECCDNKTHQIIQKMILSGGLELKLSLLLRTTASGQHPLFLEMGQKLKKYVNFCSY